MNTGMQEVRRVVSAGRRRLTVIAWLRTAVLTLTGGLVLLIVARVVERLFGLEFPWPTVFAWSAGGAVAVSVVWALLVRPSTQRAALAVDEAAGLRESLSTALSLEQSPSPWAGAVLESARAKAVTVKLPVSMPLRGPSYWYAPIVAAVALVVAWISVPRVDLLGLFAKREEERQAQRQIVEVKADLQLKEQRLAEALARAGVDIKNEPGGDTDEPRPADAAQTPEELQRAAVRRLTMLNERLSEMKQSEKAQQLEALRDSMQQLKQPGPGPLNEFARNLAMGDFAKAQESLAELSKQLAEGQMSPEQREQLRKQLENLSEQLKKAAENTRSLEEAMQKAGIDPAQAKELAKQMLKDPQAAKKALEELTKGMSEEQKQQLAQAAKAMSDKSGQCNSLSQSMGEMAQAMSQEGQEGQSGEQMAEAMQGAGEMLSEMEMLSQEMGALQQAMDEAQSQLAGLCEGMGDGAGSEGDSMLAGEGGIGEWEEGESDMQGNGSGGSGKGMGPSVADSPAAFQVDKTKQASANKGGPIIASRLVFGDQVKGESVREFSDAVESGAQAAAEALENNVIPREMKNPVQHYFGALEKRRTPAQPQPQPQPDQPAQPKN